MKEQYNELKEDVLDEEKAIDETIKRLLEAKGNFNPQKQDNLTEPAMGTAGNLNWRTANGKASV